MGAKNEHITLTVEDFEGFFNAIDRITTGKSLQLVYYSLRDTYDFGCKRISRLHDHISDYIRDISNNDAEVFDYVEHLQKRDIHMEYLVDLFVIWSKQLQPFRFFREQWLYKSEQGKGLTKKKLTVKRNDLERLISASEKFTQERAHAIACYALNKHYGIGAERMEVINKKYRRNLENVADGTINLRNVEGVLRDECKIVFDDAVPIPDAYWVRKLKPLRRILREWRREEE